MWRNTRFREGGRSTLCYSARADAPCAPCLRGHTTYNLIKLADVAKLADAHDSGSCGRPCRFKSCHPHQFYRSESLRTFRPFLLRQSMNCDKINGINNNLRLVGVDNYLQCRNYRRLCIAR